MQTLSAIYRGMLMWTRQKQASEHWTACLPARLNIWQEITITNNVIFINHAKYVEKWKKLLSLLKNMFRAHENISISRMLFVVEAEKKEEKKNSRVNEWLNESLWDDFLWKMRFECDIYFPDPRNNRKIYTAIPHPANDERTKQTREAFNIIFQHFRSQLAFVTKDLSQFTNHNPITIYAPWRQNVSSKQGFKSESFVYLNYYESEIVLNFHFYMPLILCSFRKSFFLSTVKPR